MNYSIRLSQYLELDNGRDMLVLQDDSKRVASEEEKKRLELSAKFHETVKVCKEMHFSFLALQIVFGLKRYM